MLKNKTRSGAAAKFLKEMLVLTIVASRNAFALLHHKATTSCLPDDSTTKIIMTSAVQRNAFFCITEN